MVKVLVTEHRSMVVEVEVDGEMSVEDVCERALEIADGLPESHWNVSSLEAVVSGPGHLSGGQNLERTETF